MSDEQTGLAHGHCHRSTRMKALVRVRSNGNFSPRCSLPFPATAQ